MRIAGSWKGYGIAFLSAVLVCGGPPVGVGYLARLGPGPLRFRPEYRRKVTEVLAPLPVADESTNTPIEMPVEQPAVANYAAGLEIDPDEFLPPLVSLPESSSGSTPGTNTFTMPGGQMVPQMLLQYFVHGTNRTVGVSAPVEFIPPAPPSARSSAVYISK